MEAAEYCTFSAEGELDGCYGTCLQNYYHLLYTKNGEQTISWITSFGRSPYQRMQ